MRMRQVFIPGGHPQYTYVRRERTGLEGQIGAASDNLCKLVTLTGPTKSGKSVLVQRVLPPERAIWLDGGSVSNEDDLWLQVLDRLGGATEVSKTSKSEGGSESAVETSVEGGIPLFTKAEAKLAITRGRAHGTGESRSRRVAPKAKALDLLRRSRVPLVIDDFHYLDRTLQGAVVRALKALIFGGHPVVFLAIPHRKFDAVRVEREMTGRVQHVLMPPWTPEELQEIANTGFPLLNLRVDPEVVRLFQRECLASPHLMQEFCRQLCEENGIEETAPGLRQLGFVEGERTLFERVARDTSKTVFDRLAKGPRARTDRKQRAFRDGSRGDIYLAVLLAIAALKPGMTTLEYEEVRSSLREIVVELPQANEVSSVLDHMAAIQADDQASAPVLDWEKEERRLHITDPFFAFFLRWGMKDFRTKEAGA